MPSCEKMKLIRAAILSRELKNVKGENPLFTPEDLNSRTPENPVHGRDLADGKKEFKLNRGMLSVLIDNEMLASGKKVTSKLLQKATVRVADEERLKAHSLSDGGLSA